MELMVVMLLTLVVIGLMSNRMFHSKANRDCDSTANTLEGALVLARQTAINKNGSRVDLVLPNGSVDGTWTIVAANTAVQQGKLLSTTTVTVAPAASNVTFLANGAAASASNITVQSRRTARTWTINIGAATGAIRASLTAN